MGDVEDSLKRLEHVTHILTYYTEIFEMFRSKVDNYFKHPAESIPWNFDEELVLGRIINFQKRLAEIKVRDLSLKIQLSTHRSIISYLGKFYKKYCAFSFQDKIDYFDKIDY